MVGIGLLRKSVVLAPIESLERKIDVNTKMQRVLERPDM
jgi:hypothetical protein